MRKLPRIGSTGQNVSCSPSNLSTIWVCVQYGKWSRLISQLSPNLDPEMASAMFYVSENHEWFKKKMEYTHMWQLLLSQSNWKSPKFSPLHTSCGGWVGGCSPKPLLALRSAAQLCWF
jgi:hypothetical protein